MKKVFYNSQAEIIRPGQRIGAGGEGKVSEIDGRDDLVMKVYHEPPSAEKAEKLIVLSRLGTERLFKLSTWPVDVLRDRPAGDVVGFIMRKIDQAEEVHTLHSPRSRLQKFPEASWAFLIYVAANFARAVAAVHEHGFVIGDVNPKNTLVTKKATVFLLDCDSFQIVDEGKIYRCEGGFPEYTPPELQGVPFRDVDRKPEHDCFGLAVVIFQLLFMGWHPFSGRFMGVGELPLEQAVSEFRFAYGADAASRQMRQPPGTLALEAVSAPIADMFRRAFLSTSPTDRPQAREWIAQLDSLSKSLKKCALHSGHHYYKVLVACPWCEIETKARVRLFNFLLEEADQKRGHFNLNDIWKGIAAVQVEAAPPAPPVSSLDGMTPSEEARQFVRNRRMSLILSIQFSAIAGFFIPFITDFPGFLWWMAAAGFIARTFAISGGSGAGWLQTLTTSSQTIPDNPLVKKIQARVEQSEDEVRQLEQRWEKEVDLQQFFSELNELRVQKETYENLSRIRVEKIRQRETAARRASAQSRMAIQKEVEKEIDGMRTRLERELSRGAFYLRRLSQEVEGSRLKLEPALMDARAALAQAEKDFQAVIQRNSAKPAIFVLIIAFLIGSFWSSLNESGRNVPQPHYPVVVTESAPPPAPSYNNSESISVEKMDEAIRLYKQGNELARKGKFKAASELLQRSVELYPQLSQAYEVQGYILYRLGRFEESKVASIAAISLNTGFSPYYNLGLVFVAEKNWKDAKESLLRAIAYRTNDSWEDSYTEAYYYLGLSLTRLGEIESAIQTLESNLQVSQFPTDRFDLGNLYLWAGQHKAAEAQLNILKKDEPVLANELRKLMKRHRIRN